METCPAKPPSRFQQEARITANATFQMSFSVPRSRSAARRGGERAPRRRAPRRRGHSAARAHAGSGAATPSAAKSARQTLRERHERDDEEREAQGVLERRRDATCSRRTTFSSKRQHERPGARRPATLSMPGEHDDAEGLQEEAPPEIRRERVHRRRAGSPRRRQTPSRGRRPRRRSGPR